MTTENILWNDGWQFCLTDIGAFDIKTITQADGWYDVELPHDWLVNDTRRLYETGEGWYRKRFSFDGAAKRLFVNFDGVYMNSSVYVNGEKAGDWTYGYSAFELEITGLVRAGENEIIVQVRHEEPNSRWYSGAGIFRSVTLKKRGESYIENGGVYISAKENADGWTVHIDSATVGGTRIKHTLLAPDGTVFAEVEGEISGGKSELTLEVKNPLLWDTESPALYTAVSELYDGGESCDRAENRFGFRTTLFSPQEGFFLNGRHMKMHGVCMHHDLGALGAAMNKNALRRQLEIMKSIGVNAIRTSHNMTAREFMELCDEMGLLVVAESFDMWEYPKTKFDNARFFPETYKRDVASWVRRDRNHPCIIMWSIGNEIFDTHASPRGLEVAKMLVEEVTRHDYRFNARCTIGSNFMPWENAQRVADYLKLAGYNYAERLYDEHHAAHPDWFIYGSETASAVRSRGIYHMPLSAQLLTHDDLQCSDLGNSVVGWGSAQEKAWIMDRDREWCGGQFVWTGFDYIGEPTPYSTKNSYFGMVDTAGFLKASAYFYKAVWTDGKKDPFVKIVPHWDWNEGEIIDVLTYSNVEDVELFLNGKSLGRQHIDLLHGNVLHGHWQVPFEKGVLTAKAYLGGKTAAEDREESFGEAAKLTLKADKTFLKADGRDLIFIEIGAADENGTPVANARSRVKITVSGAARLVGLDSGDSTDYDGYKSDNKRLFGGKLLAIIQAGFASGEIRVSAESEGLEGAQLTLGAEACEKPEGVSVVDGAYPAYRQEYTKAVYVRKIALSADRKLLGAEHTTALVKAEILPHNASFGELTWKCVLANGVETPAASVKPCDGGAEVIAKGDGSFILRAFSANGGENPEVFSDLSFTAQGLGDALTDPYRFVSASLFVFSNTTPRIIERGAIGGIDGRTVIGFDNVDFGGFGSSRMRLHIGNSTDSDIEIAVWDGNPDKGGRKITTVVFRRNSLWDRFAPDEFLLPERLRGIRSIAFELDKSCIFGGFDFIRENKAYSTLSAGDRDGVYGDDFTVNDGKIENIGNNVVISYTDMEFDGLSRVTLRGKTPNETNPVQLRFTPCGGGDQITRLVEFKRSADYSEQSFSMDTLAGRYDMSLVFLPGSSFGLDWIKFD